MRVAAVALIASAALAGCGSGDRARVATAVSGRTSSEFCAENPGACPGVDESTVEVAPPPRPTYRAPPNRTPADHRGPQPIAGGDGPACGARALRAEPGSSISPATGEVGVTVRLRNRGQACRLGGYPKVVLRDEHGLALPFHYGHGLYQQPTPRPRTWLIPRGGAVEVYLTAYRCDLGRGRSARFARLTFPHAGSHTLDLLGVGIGLPYCPGGRHAPGGHAVLVTAVVPPGTN